MKKAIVAILLLVYALSSTGAIVHLDYCCGKLANISLSHVQKAKCNMDMVSAKKCCDSKQLHLKVKGAQQAPVKWENSQKQYAAEIIVFAESNATVIRQPVKNEFSNGPPLLRLITPLYIQHCAFRI